MGLKKDSVENDSDMMRREAAIVLGHTSERVPVRLAWFWNGDQSKRRPDTSDLAPDNRMSSALLGPWNLIENIDSYKIIKW